MSVDEPSTYQDLIDRARQRHPGASTRELARKAREAGFAIVGTTISQMQRGIYSSQPQPSTLEALAWLAGVPYKKVHRIAGLGEVRPPFAEQLPANVDLLSAREREALVGLMRVMLADRKPGDVAHEHPREVVDRDALEALLDPERDQSTRVDDAYRGAG